MEEALIEFKDVTKRFGNKTVLDCVNMTVYEGHVTTIIGKSGTGKSVLLKHIIGLLSPNEGAILFRGKPIKEMSRRELSEFNRQFSYCFQNNALFDSMTVFDNVALPLRQKTKMSKKEIESRVLEKIDQLELSEVPHRYPSELSGGMQKRVALARALITDPKIVLFDEPTTGQDPIRKNAILGMIAQNQKKFGFTTIMISHDIPDVFFISDRVLILYDGQIIFQGTSNELDRLQHPMVDEFVMSLEGFQDELTGLHSKKSFSTAYEQRMAEGEPNDRTAVAVFLVNDLDGLSESVGHTRAHEMVQALGENINRFFGDVGISCRLGMDQITTIFPQTPRSVTERMMDDFARNLQESGLGGMKALCLTQPDAAGSFTFSVSAGIAEGGASDDMEKTVAEASSNQRIIARFTCGDECKANE